MPRDTHRSRGSDAVTAPPLPHEGALSDASSVGECGATSCGYGVRVAIRVAADGRIEDARFEVASPAAARPAASALCAALVGSTVDAAAALSLADVERITSLPRGNPVARTVHFAKSAAVQPLLRARGGGDRPVVCVCFHVTSATIRAAVREHRLTTVDEVRTLTRASAGCGTCRPDVQRLVDAERGAR